MALSRSRRASVFTTQPSAPTLRACFTTSWDDSWLTNRILEPGGKARRCVGRLRFHSASQGRRPVGSNLVAVLSPFEHLLIHLRLPPSPLSRACFEESGEGITETVRNLRRREPGFEM